jgi:FtsP/CotA-like multicopper oxidase with cupredoxin domain
MGMYGLLIVDPPEGPGRVYEGGPRYDVEAVWVADEIDPSWRHLDELAGVECPFSLEDPGMNNFNPEYFLISGVSQPRTRTDSRVKVSARVGETILIRVANAGYTVQEFTIEGLGVEVVSIDGRPLVEPYAEPFIVPAGKPFDLTTAQRWDLILKPERPGRYPVKVKFKDWISGEVRGLAETFINVSTGEEEKKELVSDRQDIEQQK